MIAKIHNAFKELSRQHKAIRGFYCGKVSKSLGTGEQFYPLCFLEDNMCISTSKIDQATLNVNVNFQILMLPQAYGNKYTVVECESVSERIAQQYLLKLKADRKGGTSEIGVASFNTMSVSNWYDDKSAGVRVSCTLQIPNEVNYCELDDFDGEGKFEHSDLFSDIDTTGAEDCHGRSNYAYKFPKINY